MKKYKCIHILGGAGSGTTTLGEKVSNKYGYTHLDSDNYYWDNNFKVPFTLSRKPEERVRLLKKDMNYYTNIILSGALCGWGDEFIELFDLVIYLNVSTETRLNRIKKREKERFGDRVLKGGDMYEKHMEFLEWARQYDTGDENIRSYKQHKKWLEKVSCPIIEINENDNIYEVLKGIFS